MSVYLKSCPRCQRSMGQHCFSDDFSSDSIREHLAELCENCQSSEKSMQVALTSMLPVIVAAVIEALDKRR